MTKAKMAAFANESNPEPFTPPDCKLSDFRFMPLEVARLRRSKQWLIAKRRPEIGFYVLNLWAASWHETPAASLDDDDDVLADAAMCAPDVWDEVRADVLRGWVKCSDGRLYHPTVAEKALEGWLEKLNQRKSSEAGNAKRYGRKFDPRPIEKQIRAVSRMLKTLVSKSGDKSKGSTVSRRESRIPHQRANRDRKGREGKGYNYSASASAREAAPPDLVVIETPEPAANTSPSKPANDRPLDRCLAVAGPGLADPDKEPGLHLSAARIAAAMAAGCDLELDILPVIAARTAKARGSPITTWGYFDKPWAEQRDKRLAGFDAPDPTRFSGEKNGTTRSTGRNSGSLVEAAVRLANRGGMSPADEGPDGELAAGAVPHRRRIGAGG